VPDSQTRDARVGQDELQRASYSADLQPLLQSWLAALADLVFDFEQERERVSNSTSDPKLREPPVRKLAERHRERRDPFVRNLALLRSKMMPSRGS
jgi:hypothetical protein